MIVIEAGYYMRFQRAQMTSSTEQCLSFLEKVTENGEIVEQNQAIQ